MFFGNWDSLLRVAVVGVPAYLFLLLLLRIGGKRTLSKFNAFDLVVTVAFGSTLSAALVSPELALVDVVAAFAVLVGLQFMITWTVVRWHSLERVIKAEPRLLFHNGTFLEAAMRHERITRRELEAAVRAQGFLALAQVESVVLETDGSFSVVGHANHAPTAMRTVEGHQANQAR